MKLTPIQKRFLLFLGGCIPMRLFFVFVAWIISIKYLPLLGYIALLPAIGFLYLLFAIYAIKGFRSAYLFLLADVLIGLMLFLWFHYTNGNIKRVFM